MRILIFILFIFFSGCAKSQLYFPAIIPEQGLQPILIIFSGESNSGGIAPNSSATSPELAQRALPIFNNNSRIFEPLDIGSNNIIDHLNLEAYESTTHSWELQLANRYDDGDFGGRPVYLVKTGQGGTMISHWAVGATYTVGANTLSPWTEMQARVDESIALIETETGQTPELVLFYSQGINDGITGTSTATWKTATKAHIDKIRVKYPAIPVFMMSFEFTASNYYDTQINEIASEMTAITVIPTTGLTNVGDGYHLSYSGQKAWANAAIDAYLTP